VETRHVDMGGQFTSQRIGNANGSPQARGGGEAVGQGGESLVGAVGHASQKGAKTWDNGQQGGNPLGMIGGSRLEGANSSRSFGSQQHGDADKSGHTGNHASPSTNGPQTHPGAGDRQVKPSAAPSSSGGAEKGEDGQAAQGGGEGGFLDSLLDGELDEF